MAGRRGYQYQSRELADSVDALKDFPNGLSSRFKLTKQNKSTSHHQEVRDFDSAAFESPTKIGTQTEQSKSTALQAQPGKQTDRQPNVQTRPQPDSCIQSQVIAQPRTRLRRAVVRELPPSPVENSLSKLIATPQSIQNQPPSFSASHVVLEHNVVHRRMPTMQSPAATSIHAEMPFNSQAIPFRPSSVLATPGSVNSFNIEANMVMGQERVVSNIESVNSKSSITKRYDDSGLPFDSLSHSVQGSSRISIDKCSDLAYTNMYQSIYAGQDAEEPFPRLTRQEYRKARQARIDKGIALNEARKQAKLKDKESMDLDSHALDLSTEEEITRYVVSDAMLNDQHHAGTPQCDEMSVDESARLAKRDGHSTELPERLHPGASSWNASDSHTLDPKFSTMLQTLFTKARHEAEKPNQPEEPNQPEQPEQLGQPDEPSQPVTLLPKFISTAPRMSQSHMPDARQHIEVCPVPALFSSEKEIDTKRVAKTEIKPFSNNFDGIMEAVKTRGRGLKLRGTDSNLLRDQVYFDSWGPKLPGESRTVPTIRRIKLTGLPSKATAKDVTSLVYGGGLEQITRPPNTSHATVLFLKSEECMKYHNSTANGIPYPADDAYMVSIDLHTEHEPVSSLVKQYIEREVTRCVRCVGLDEKWTAEGIKALAHGKAGSPSKLEHVLLKTTATGAREAQFRFCDISDAVRFKAQISRDETLEDCNIQYFPDPCAIASGVHL